MEGPVNSAPVETNATVATKGLQYARYLFFAPEAVQSLFLSQLPQCHKPASLSPCRVLLLDTVDQAKHGYTVVRDNSIMTHIHNFGMRS